MLKTVWLTKQQNIRNGTALLLGGFDGLHVGHQTLVKKAKSTGYPIGIMTIFGGKEGNALFALSEREEIFKKAGIDFVIEMAFEKIKALSYVQFLQLLEDKFQPKTYICGEDFRFGANAEGTPEKIKQATQVCVEILPLLQKNGEKVSSRDIKSLLKIGDIEKANQLLDDCFFAQGEVVKDRQIGRKIGFPTANMVYPKEKFPLKTGVYETRTEVDGKIYKGITNYGARPTFADENVMLETYLDGFEGDLYGRKLEVQFVRFLREIQKFEGLEELKGQLQKDIDNIRGIKL